MPFLGSTPAEQYQSLAKQTITGDGSTAYTLNRSVTNAYDMEVFINNVRQEPDTSYSASGNTITFTAAVTASDSCYLIYQGQSVGSINPPANSVGGSQIQSTSVTHNHLHSSLDLSSKTLTMPAGHVIQTVTMGHVTGSQITAGGNHTILSNTITPKFSNSKIMILGGMQLHPDDASSYWMIRLLRGTTSILPGLYSAIGYNTAAGVRDHMAIHHIDTPSTTSATTYNIQLERSSGSGSIRVNYSDYGSITLMEIAQ